MTKYKFKNKKQINLTLYIGIILGILLLSVSTAYSLFSEPLNIKGLVTFNYSEKPLKKIEIIQNGKNHMTVSNGNLKLINTQLVNDSRFDLTANFSSSGINNKTGKIVITTDFKNSHQTTMSNGKYDLIFNTTSCNPNIIITDQVKKRKKGNIIINIPVEKGKETPKGKLIYKISYKTGKINRVMYINLNIK